MYLHYFIFYKGDMMSSIDIHEEDCMRLIGAPFNKVHKWLDKYAKKWNPFVYGEYHRKFRHNREGVKEVGKMWGPLYEKAAKIHMIRDVELYVLHGSGKMFRDIMGDEIDELYEKCLRYHHVSIKVKEF